MDTENQTTEPRKAPARASEDGNQEKRRERPARRPPSDEREERDDGARERPPAKRPPSDEKNERDERDDGARERERRPAQPPEPEGRRRELPAPEIARRAVEQLRQLTTREIEGVVGISRDEDGVWTVVLEVVESHHFPDSSDVMAEYSVKMSPSGDLVGYTRGQRYLRGRPQSS